MGSLLSRLLTVLNDSDLSSTDYHIAMTFLLHYHLLADMSISVLADMCSVSKSTISKFIRNLGYEDYADFKSVAPFKENRFGCNLNYNQNIAEYIEAQGIVSYIDNVKDDIMYAIKSVDIQCVKKLAEYLTKYEKVAAFGVLFSEIGAMDLQFKLAYNGKFIITNLSDTKQRDFLLKATEDMLIIIYSNSGDYMLKYQLSEFREAKDFSQIKAKIALITSNSAMARHPCVDLCICYGHKSSIQTHSYLYPLVNDMIIMEYRKLTKQA